MVRFSVGIEHLDDLKNDLNQALNHAQQMKVDILAFGAHPDDIELGCGVALPRPWLMEKSGLGRSYPRGIRYPWLS